MPAGWMEQNLINYSSIGPIARPNPGQSRRHRPAPTCTGVPNSSFDKHPSIQASKHPCFRSRRSAAEAVACKFAALPLGGAGHAESFVRISKSEASSSPCLCRRPLPNSCPKFPQIHYFSDLRKTAEKTHKIVPEASLGTRPNLKKSVKIVKSSS